MITLYINDEHCSSVEQLRGYFNKEIKYGSPMFMDLVDYGRAGELAQWLIEQGETELAKDVDSINENIGDGEYISLLSSILKEEKSLSNFVVSAHRAMQSYSFPFSDKVNLTCEI